MKLLFYRNTHVNGEAKTLSPEDQVVWNSQVHGGGFVAHMLEPNKGMTFLQVMDAVLSYEDLYHEKRRNSIDEVLAALMELTRIGYRSASLPLLFTITVQGNLSRSIDMNKPRPYTEEEIRQKFLDHIWTVIDYWDTVPQRQTTREKISGAVFSILAMMDGDSPELPGFLIVPHPHISDKEYYKENGENWYPSVPGKAEQKLCDIGGGLHEEFYQHDPQRRDDDRKV
jgi:hypothetical protein